jgi:hypothetical protein
MQPGLAAPKVKAVEGAVPSHSPACRLQATEAQLQQCRLHLAAAKARREVLAGARAELRKDWDLVTDRRCLADMKAQVGGQALGKHG